MIDNDVVMVSSVPAAPIRTARTLLRPFEECDVRGRMQCGEDPDIIRMFGGSPEFDVPVPMTFDQARAWYEQVTGQPSPSHWAIEFEGSFIGTARLHTFVEIDRRARYAVGILDRNLLGRGLGTEITRAVVEYGFSTLALHRIDLRVLAYNTRAIRCYQRCGFVQEGREREAAFVDDRWHDDVIMSILEHEIPPISESA